MESRAIIPVGFAPVDPAYSITGWPNEAACPRCGARAVLLVSSGEAASYECRGTAHGSSDYGDDRCGAVSRLSREPSCAECGGALTDGEREALARDTDFVSHGDPEHLIRVEPGR
jgi:hypothetical protein